MVYTITFNPAIDYIAKVDRLIGGETNRTKDEILRPGGKGINVSIVLKRLGIPSIAIAFTGGFTGAAIEKMLKETGIATEYIHCEGNTRINIKLKGKMETEINGKGVVINETEMALLLQKLACLKDGDWLVLAGSIPTGMLVETYGIIMKLLSDRDVKVVVDATGELLKHTLAYKPFLIKPNVQELGEIFKVEIETEEQIEHYAKELMGMGARNVIVSMAGSGALMVTEDGQTLRSLPPRGKVVDSVGAGDSMVAGFIAGYLKTGSYEEALKLGLATGSATAFSSWLAEKRLVENLRKQMDQPQD